MAAVTHIHEVTDSAWDALDRARHAAPDQLVALLLPAARRQRELVTTVLRDLDSPERARDSLHTAASARHPAWARDARAVLRADASTLLRAMGHREPPRAVDVAGELESALRVALNEERTHPDAARRAAVAGLYGFGYALDRCIADATARQRDPTTGPRLGELVEHGSSIGLPVAFGTFVVGAVTGGPGLGPAVGAGLTAAGLEILKQSGRLSFEHLLGRLLKRDAQAVPAAGQRRLLLDAAAHYAGLLDDELLRPPPPDDGLVGAVGVALRSIADAADRIPPDPSDDAAAVLRFRGGTQDVHRALDDVLGAGPDHPESPLTVDQLRANPALLAVTSRWAAQRSTTP